MTDLQKKEIWAFGIVAFAFIFSLILGLLDQSNASIDSEYIYGYAPFSIYLPLLLLFVSMVCIGIIGVFYFYVLPKYSAGQNNTRLFSIIIIAFISLIAVITLYTYSTLSSFWHHDNYNRNISLSVALRDGLLKSLLISFCVAFYHFLKLRLLDVYNRFTPADYIKREVFEKTILVCVVVILGAVTVLTFHQYLHRVWRSALWFLTPIYLSLFIIGLHYVYPKYYSENKKIKLFLRIILSTLIVGIPFFTVFIGTANFKDGSNETLFVFFIILSIPLLWVFTKIFYDDIIKKSGTIDELQIQVNTTTANIDFLRSQINPHFLFNALNTLYGLSLTENAERTAEGIQKLGEMMRFMLTENQQQKVSIEKEVNYITNYIGLQKLRTQASDSIVISFKKYSHDCNHSIAPMLLIPLIENAFKHGISLSQPSWININLSCDEKKIYLDVYNSVHQKNENDTEKLSNGIGLANVKQRLLLLYPNKHELQIRNTPHEYIVHLTIEP